MKRIGGREFLEVLGGAALVASLPQGARVQGAKTPLRFGTQTSVWGSVGMVAAKGIKCMGDLKGKREGVEAGQGLN